MRSRALTSAFYIYVSIVVYNDEEVEGDEEVPCSSRVPR